MSLPSRASIGDTLSELGTDSTSRTVEVTEAAHENHDTGWREGGHNAHRRTNADERSQRRARTTTQDAANANELTNGRTGRHCLRRVLLCPAARNSWGFVAAVCLLSVHCTRAAVAAAAAADPHQRVGKKIARHRNSSSSCRSGSPPPPPPFSVSWYAPHRRAYACRPCKIILRAANLTPPLSFSLADAART